MSEEIDLEKVVTSLIDPIKYAGGRLMDVYSQEKIESMVKPIHGRCDVVTEGDMISDAFLCNIVRELFPNFGIVSEERYDEFNLGKIEPELNKKYCFAIDACDGSDDFKQKTGEFVLLIALLDLEKKKPVVGMSYKPITQELVTATAGKGAYSHSDDGSKKRLRVSDVTELNQSHLVTSKFHNEEVMKYLLDDIKGKIGVITAKGSGGNKMVDIAKGDADWYFRVTKRIPYWDIAAGHLIVEEAMGKFTALNQSEIFYDQKDFEHKGGLLVTNGKIHQPAFEEIKKLLQETTQLL
ncbi:hypothetical protein JXB27_03935 [Candidatus Woesearchaeota archaeon]|nr:hypothetical protein [Candidatus Woesearchaeota archaeon]